MYLNKIDELLYNYFVSTLHPVMSKGHNMLIVMFGAIAV